MEPSNPDTLKPSLPILVAVIGPTGSGKTPLAEELALRFNGELISCDAKQVYRGMDIGTNKAKDLRVPQHLIDLKNPGEKVTVAEFQQFAYQEIDTIISRGKLPILVGGSMLYAEAIMNGYEFTEEGKSAVQKPKYRVLKLGVAVERTLLKERLAQRTKTWLSEGLLQEIKDLLQDGVSPAWLESCGLEYRFFTRYLAGSLTLEEAIAKTNTSLSQYVKRQYTWWRRHADVHWLESASAACSLLEWFLGE